MRKQFCHLLNGKTAVAAIGLLLLAAGCRASGDRGTAATFTAESKAKTASAIPKAVIYRMNGDFSTYVPVQTDASRSHLISFPAPTDITELTEPVSLPKGWWLDRQGVGLNTAFISVTRDKYAAMDNAPAPGYIMESILPAAFVTETAVLPFPLHYALDNRHEVDSIINNGMRGIKVKKRMIMHLDEPHHIDGTER
ncbi:MAG: hypothetical protein K2K76_02845 [Muribaculaceae bacterium]|nr:hypothetical protein [Muribaculaceae bacterium]